MSPLAAGWVLVVLVSASAASAPSLVAQTERGAQVQIDVNRPRTPFDCETPIGTNWYGSRTKCLAELCADQNVFNEYLFDGNRRRKNPCYGQSPTNYPPD